MKKKKNIIIIIIIVLLIILCLSTIFIISHKKKPKEKEYRIDDGKTIVFVEKQEDPDIKEIKSDVLNSDHCEDNICVSVSKINCKEDMGNIYYKVTNKGNPKKDGYFMITFNKKNFYLKYNNLDIGQSFESYHNYNDIDLTNVSDFKLTILDDSYSKKYK